MSSITLQNTMNWAGPFLKSQPLAVSNLEPALTSGNKILQRILNAPFRWRWNRSSLHFTCVVNESPNPGQVDYTVAAPDFGFIENVSLTDVSFTAYPPLGVVLSLPIDYSVSRPLEVSPQYDDGAGNITFRLKNAPDLPYVVTVDYQRKPPILQSLAATFAPVPDEFMFLFSEGFLMELSVLVNDSRYPVFERGFVSAILGLEDGLDDQAKNIFLEYWLNGASATLRRQQSVAQGVSARGI